MGNFPHKICFLADSHGLYDDRIYWKEAVSLKKAGYEVHYLLAGETREKGTTHEGIHFQTFIRDKHPGKHLLNYLAKRLANGLYATMLKEAALLHADVYHIHDLKVLGLAAKLKRLEHKPRLVYDVHEPYPENILDYWKSRKYFSFIRKPWSEYIRKWEKNKAADCDLIITTEENLAGRFKQYYPGKQVEVIYNYTDLSASEDWQESAKNYDAIYTGGITVNRGALNILEAVRLASSRLPAIRMLFLGSWFPETLKQEMQLFIEKHGLSENVVLMDAVPYEQIADFYRASKIGLGIFLPIATHRIILQIKIFEYMRFGLPIVGSNFGHIHDYLERHQCGIAVDPEKPEEIAEALLTLLNDKARYKQSSENGFRAAQEHYRWAFMEEKLVHRYKNLLASQ